MFPDVHTGDYKVSEWLSHEFAGLCDARDAG